MYTGSSVYMQTEKQEKKEYILVLNDFVMLQNKIRLSTNFILNIIL